MNRREGGTTMKVIPSFVYHPEKADRGLKAMADILAGALLRDRKGNTARKDPTTL
ncbi:MAG: hypothetical protein K0R39_4275 [Symbiobacteriaceae bacterium]|nr:hypothetical protein [Symbiobacteriaceae bacterium]